MNFNYKDYLESEKWHQFKKDFYSSDYYKELNMSDGFECYCCKCQNNLHLHHLSYENIFNETFKDVVPVCKSCHFKIHSLHKKFPKESIFSITANVKNNTAIKKIVLTKEQKKLLRKIKNERKKRRKFAIKEKNKNSKS